MVISCQQGQAVFDGDPDVMYHFHSLINPKDYKDGDMLTRYGQTPQPSDQDSNDDNISLIFLETIRDIADQYAWQRSHQIAGAPNFTMTDIEQTTVVHEVGHQFGCVHPPAPDGSIMDEGVENPNLVFSATSLKQIRKGAYIGVP